MKGLAFFAVILSASAIALGQLNPVWPSVDLLVAQADAVVIGRIAEMGEASDDAIRGKRQPIVLAVDETLKGPSQSQVRLTIDGDLRDLLDREKILCIACAEHSHRLLVTVGYARNAPPPVHAIDLDDPSVRDVTGDLRPLTGGAAIAQAARAEVRRCPGRLAEDRTFGWGPSRTFMPGTIFHGATVIVPVDERQEKLARQVLASQHAPAEVIRSVFSNDRAAAVSVLAFFRSPGNIRILKSLLDDSQIQYYAMGELDYSVRAAAYRVLRQWHIDVPQPVTHVNIQEPWNGTVPPDGQPQAIQR